MHVRLTGMGCLRDMAKYIEMHWSRKFSMLPIRLWYGFKKVNMPRTFRPWHAQARRDQLPPTDRDWRTYLIEVGRGWGKTRTCAEWIVEQAVTHPGTDWAIVAPRPPELRKICIDGSSGVLRVLQPGELDRYNAPELTVRLTNGSRILGYAANEYGCQRLRDSSDFAGAWLEDADEFPNITDVWNDVTSVTSGRIVISTAPVIARDEEGLREAEAIADASATYVDVDSFSKAELWRAISALERERRSALVRPFFHALAARPDTIHITGSTWSNAANLSPIMLAELRKRYEDA